eukprot:TRINITY_DN10800_c0_g1_i1.p1 TRINITY_DN10800_c0_g1~~TRINITY_DN10800_c0_g1_i1.p1  ORF type:complete len:346 (+),score=79.70 TRINITY_DN10800_c0_g1_i1:117-1154(+)
MSRYDATALLSNLRRATPAGASTPYSASLPASSPAMPQASPYAPVASDDLNTATPDTLKRMVCDLRRRLDYQTSLNQDVMSRNAPDPSIRLTVSQLLEEKLQLQTEISEHQRRYVELQENFNLQEERTRVITQQRDEAIRDMERMRVDRDSELQRSDQLQAEASAAITRAKQQVKQIAAERDDAFRKTRELTSMSDLLTQAQDTLKTLLAEREMLQEALKTAQSELRQMKAGHTRSKTQPRSSSPPPFPLSPTPLITATPVSAPVSTPRSGSNLSKRPAFTAAVSTHSSRHAPTHEIGALHLSTPKRAQKPVMTIDLSMQSPRSVQKERESTFVVPVTLADLMNA